MRRFLLAASVTALIASTACSYKASHLPGAGLPFAEVNYQVLGSTNAEECGTYIIGIDFAHLFSNEGAASAGGGDIFQALGSYVTLTVRSPEAARALYYALEKMPEATHLLSPRVHTTVDGPIAPMGIPIFAKRCATVEARGIKIGSGPK